MADTHSNMRAYCPDCGPAGVSHFIERWSVRTGDLVGILEAPPAAVWRGIKPLLAKARPGRLAPATARFFAAIGLGEIKMRPDDKANWRTRVLWEEAGRRGIVMREFRPFGLPREIFYASFGHDTHGFDGLPRPRAAHEAALDWMDDKGVILKKFRKAGIPVPCGGCASTIKAAEKIFHEIGPPSSSSPRSARAAATRISTSQTSARSGARSGRRKSFRRASSWRKNSQASCSASRSWVGRSRASSAASRRT